MQDIDKTQDSAQALPPKPRTDKQIWGIYVALSLVSLVELYSASSFEVKGMVLAPWLRHAMFLGIGLCIMLFLQRTHYKHFLKPSYLFALVSFGAMLYTMKYGEYVNGARRHFSAGGLFVVQPAEMIKLSVALLIAAILCKSRMKKDGDVSTLGMVLVVGVLGVAAGLLIMQGLTNTLLLIGIGLSMMIIGGVSFKKIFYMLGVMGILAAGYMLVSHHSSGSQAEAQTVAEVVVPGTDVVVAQSDGGASSSKLRDNTWKARISRHLRKDKYNDPITNENRQEQYSFLAQAHGGVTGVLPGNSRETVRLPLAFSDYIYAIIIEEMGLVGGIAVLVLYLWLLARAGVVAARCQTAYPALLVIGMAIYITLQAIVHMAIVTGLFPVSGQPLPLISKGGTSILITSVALGIMLSVSRFAARKGRKDEIKEERKLLSDDVAAINLV